ncbi:hypothetical protein GCM10020331_076380 [Ectobacillus funiculus]
MYEKNNTKCLNWEGIINDKKTNQEKKAGYILSLLEKNSVWLRDHYYSRRKKNYTIRCNRKKTSIIQVEIVCRISSIGPQAHDLFAL